MMRNKINELSLLQKISLSIFPILATIFFIDTFFFYNIPYEYYAKLWLGLFILMIIHNIILIIRINKKEIEPNNKIFYIILVFVIVLFHLYYVWYLDKKYRLK